MNSPADPSSGRAAVALGRICYDLGKSWEALPHFEQALQLDPHDADALCGCGQALADVGQTDLGVTFLRKAVEAAPEELRYKVAAANVLQGIEFTAPDPWYEAFFVECFDHPLLPSATVTNAALSLLWTKPALRDALAAERLEQTHLTRLADEPLLLRLLSATIVRSWEFECFFTKLRQTLALASDRAPLALLAAVAEQAFNAGYVQGQSSAEAALEQELLDKGAAALTPAELTVLAAYRALIDAPEASAIVEGLDVPECVERVVRRTLREPLRELEIRDGIAALTPIGNEVSERVRAQYEEHPYPRWIELPTAGEHTRRLVDELGRQMLTFAGAGWPERPKVLVPGCGTGYHPLSMARQHPETDVLAVDLSRTSLAYAIRKQQELGIPNVQLRQADLLELGRLDERFDYIDCAGVLHHLESPFEGWRVLSDLLKPGGVMRIGLYSELARGTVIAARDKAAQLRVAATPSQIRAFRQAIMSDPALSALRRLASTTGDFFSMGEIRDLIFHVQEHRFDLPTIKRHLGALGLEFGGFLLANRDVVRRFQKLNPTREQWLDLDRWAEFEARHPSTFHEMYQFYCLKPTSRSPAAERVG